MHLLGVHGVLKRSSLLAAALFLALAGVVAVAVEPSQDEYNTGSGDQWQPGDPLYDGNTTERDYFGTQGRSTQGEKCVGNVIPVDKIAGGKSWNPGCYAIRGDTRHACCGCISWPTDPYSIEEFKSEGLPVCNTESGEPMQPDDIRSGSEAPDGSKNVYRVPSNGGHPGGPSNPGIERLAEAIDDCLRRSVQEGWGLYDTPSLVEYSEGTASYDGGSVYFNPAALSRMSPEHQAYVLAAAYAGHVLFLRNRYVQHGQPGMYDAMQPGPGDTDRVVGFATRCLMNRKLLPMPTNLSPDDPRNTYMKVVGNNPGRIKAFDNGFQRWPLSPLYTPKNSDRWQR